LLLAGLAIRTVLIVCVGHLLAALTLTRGGGLAFARLLVQQPDIVILDEATSALDTESQDSMMELFRNELANCTLISVGHRPELAEYHTRTLTLIRHASGATMSSKENKSRDNRITRIVRRAIGPR
jgi:putative ATP-binding cassette transporter